MSEQKTNSGVLQLLEFRSNSDGSPKNPQKGKDVFRVMINPDSISHTVRLLTTNNTSVKSKDKGDTHSCDTETISFTFYLDGTNVVPLPFNQNETRKSVSDLVKDFLKTVYKKNPLFDKDELEKEQKRDDIPVRALFIEYGDMFWTVRINTITIDHTLFDRNGKSLRAKVTCSFETITDDDSKQNPSTSPPSKKNDNLCDCTQVCTDARNNNQDSLFTPADANLSTIDGREIKV